MDAKIFNETMGLMRSNNNGSPNHLLCCSLLRVSLAWILDTIIITITQYGNTVEHQCAAHIERTNIQYIIIGNMNCSQNGIAASAAIIMRVLAANTRAKVCL